MSKKQINPVADGNAELARAVRELGGKSAVARILHVSPAAIDQWVAGVRPFPLERCIQLEKESLGRYRCEVLRPDLRPMFDYLRSPLRAGLA